MKADVLAFSYSNCMILSTVSGGKYSGQMAYRVCTHLVIERPEGNYL